MSTDPRRWTPTETEETAAPRCQNCGTRVTQQWARVFGDNSDTAHGCPDCTTYREMQTAANIGGDTDE